MTPTTAKNALCSRRIEMVVQKLSTSEAPRQICSTRGKNTASREDSFGRLRTKRASTQEYHDICPYVRSAIGRNRESYMDKVFLLFIVIMVFTFTLMNFVIKMRAIFYQLELNQASAGEPLRSGVGVLEGVFEGVRFESTGDLLADLEDDLERDLDREFLLLLSLLELRFVLLPIGD